MDSQPGCRDMECFVCVWVGDLHSHDTHQSTSRCRKWLSGLGNLRLTHRGIDSPYLFLWEFYTSQVSLRRRARKRKWHKRKAGLYQWFPDNVEIIYSLKYDKIRSITSCGSLFYLFILFTAVTKSLRRSNLKVERICLIYGLRRYSPPYVEGVPV